MDLIPILSFVLLYGKCRNCGKKISWQYPLVEAGTALLFLALFFKFDLTVSLAFLMIVVSGLIIIFVYDLRRMVIPDEILYILAVVILIWLILYYFLGYTTLTRFALPATFMSIVWGVVMGAFIFVVLALASGEKWMGWGDAKLGALAGFFLGSPKVGVAIILAFFIGSFVSLVLMALGKRRMKDKIPLGPFIVVGILITIFFGDQILDRFLI